MLTQFRFRAGHVTALPRRSALAVMAALLVPNVSFFGVHLAARLLPVVPIRDRIAAALNSRDILTNTQEFIFLDSARGVEPWGDANTLRMAIHRGPSAWRDALAPRLMPPADGVVRHPARELHGAVFGNIPFDSSSGYYHRYWHGNVPVAAFLLSVFDVRQARLILMQTSYFLFMLLAFFGVRSGGRASLVCFSVASAGIWFSSLPYHGQTFAYAPAFIWSQVTALGALWWTGRPRSASSLVLLGLFLGAVAAFVEPMSGAFMLGACLLALAVYFSHPDSTRGLAELALAGSGAAAFLTGMGFSIIFKQAVAAIVFGWGPVIGVFISQLNWRMGLGGEKTDWVKLVRTVGEHLVYLTFGSPRLGIMLAGSAILMAVAATAFAVLDIRRNGVHSRRWDYIALLAAIAFVALWFAVLPSHNFIHAWITVRLLYLPFALCWVALVIAATAERSGLRAGAADPRVHQMCAPQASKQTTATRHN
jgi:hypothetical protein